ncbi:alpha/beta hydrolase [soil metagenome]
MTATPTPGVGAWRTGAARREFVAVHDALLDRRLPRPDATTDVDTAYGTAHVQSWVGSGVPLVLLPGAGSTAIGWAAMLPHLHGRTIHAVDTIGDVGRSVQRAPITTGRDHVAWLEQTLATLDVTAAHLLGVSYGGWRALLHARYAPDRVVSLSLLEPAGFQPIRRAFWLWSIACGLAGAAPDPIRRRAAIRLRQEGIVDPQLRRLARLGFRGFRQHFPPPTPLSDDDLRRITLPVLLLLGRHSALHDAGDVAYRATALLPDLECELLDASHSLATDHGGHVAARVREFIAFREQVSG